MSNEKLSTELSTNGRSTIIKRTVVTKQNEERVTSKFITSRTSSSNSSTSDSNPMSDSNMISMYGNNGVQKTVVTKTYTRSTIRKTGPDGVVSEEIIEKGDPINPKMLSVPQYSVQSDDSSLPIKSLSCEDLKKMKISSGSNAQVTASFNCISDTGETRTTNFSMGPIQEGFLSFSRNMSGDTDDIRSQSMRLSSLKSLENSDGSLTSGPTITTKFLTTKKSTVTQSVTINGETKTRSQSAFVSYAGENMVQANNTMLDMEGLFKEMTGQLQIERFNVLKQFMLSSTASLSDHLALAGGDEGSSLLAIEASPTPDPGSQSTTTKEKPCEETTKEPPIPEVKLRYNNKKTDEQEKEEVRQKIMKIKEQKSSNLYWSNMDEVRSSGILDEMPKEEINLQESIFEIISSEASYNISLDILIELFYKNEWLDPNREDSVIDAIQKHHLFSNILLVKGVSLQLLKDLETRWSDNKPRILDLADIILKHAEDSEFEQQYVNYLAHQSYQIESLRALLQKDNFKSVLRAIQNDPKCCKLSLDSFLALPMQRLTRLKLLLDVVLKLMNQSKELLKKIPTDVVQNHENAIKKVKELLRKSENKKFEIDQKARLSHLEKILEFKNGCKNVNIGSNILLKEGELKTRLPQIHSNALKKLSKKKQPSFYLIVLSDMVIIAKKESDSKIIVLDYCDRQLVEATVTKSASEPTLLLKFRKSESGSVTDPILFDTLSLDRRDQWIEAISTNLANIEKGN